MFSALSFLPQTGEIDEPPEDFSNLMLTNQQKLGLVDTIFNEEETIEWGISQIAMNFANNIYFNTYLSSKNIINTIINLILNVNIIIIRF